ncbi:MAG: tetratricopeptide repeat protein [Alphaproteobacteria bacterium]|nr:tetratricopeptide repeat protein [Alphaproteobacteria bacterium]
MASAGDRVGRYELVRELGRGGSGVVFEATLHGPAGFRKQVALKLLHRKDDRLVREARLGGLLRHPNLVDVYELGRADDGGWYCAMELVLGRIEDVLPLPPRAVVDVGLQICAGLSHAHEQIGLVHLDLKPANVLLDGAVVKVADLGIAQARGFEGDGQIRGTYGYMAPEQLAGWTCDARADVYSLGLVLRDLTLGLDPSDGPTRPDLSWLQPVLDRCTALVADERYPDMAAVAQALSELQVDGPSLAERVGRPPRRLVMPTAPATTVSGERDAFVGREDVIATVGSLLAAPGVLTLKGPGGIGKTRAARRSASLWGERTGMPTWFVELEAVRDAAGLFAAVASALRLRPGADPEVELGYALAGRSPCLLVLDNFEQITTLAPILERWQQAAPRLRLVATSREPLRLASERLVDLEPLPPAEALALLVDRATRHGARLDPDDPDVRKLAGSLDGLPLAIELAAARLGTFSVTQVLGRLRDRFKLLRGRTHGVPERQATLRGALDWSWDLLSEDERSTLSQLTVFRGGISLERAEEVVTLASGEWVLDVVQSLVDRSLLQARRGRFSMLDAVREYAAEQLADREAVEARHGAAFAALAAELATAELANLEAGALRAVTRADARVAARTGLAALHVGRSSAPMSWHVALASRVLSVVTDAADRVDLLLAIAWAHLRSAALEEAEQVARAAREEAVLADAVRRATCEDQLAQTLILRGRYEEAEEALRAAESLGPEGERITASTRGSLHRARGEHDLALACFRRAEQEARRSGSADQLATELTNLGLALRERGDSQEARRVTDEALGIQRELGNRRMVAVLLSQRASIRRQVGDTDGSVEDVTEARNIHRELGARLHEAITLGNLARLLRALGRVEESVARHREGVALLRALDVPRSLLLALNGLGVSLQVGGDLAAAEAAYREALAIGERIAHVELAAVASANLSSVLVDLGRLEEADARLLTDLERFQDSRRSSQLQLHRMEIALLEGRPDDALALGALVGAAPDRLGGQIVAAALHGGFEEAVGLLGEPPVGEPELRRRWWCYAAWVEALRGRADRAREHLANARREGVAGSDAMRWYRFAERAIERDRST